MLEMDILDAFKIMPEFYKNNLEKCLIYLGIYNVYPKISDEEARMIFNFCDKNMTKNINHLTLSQSVTDLYYKGEISKEDLENSQNIDVEKLSFFDKLNYYLPIEDEKSEDFLEKC